MRAATATKEEVLCLGNYRGARRSNGHGRGTRRPNDGRERARGGLSWHGDMSRALEG
jgi:hypothetical protein